MSWHYLQEQEEESSEVCSAVTLASELLNMQRTRGKFFWLDSELGSDRNSQYGRLYQPSESTMKSAENISNYLNRKPMSFVLVVDSLVKIYHQQVKEQGLQPILDQDFGLRWRESLTKYDQETSSWKTHQCLLLGGLESFSETWPKWGIMQNGECWEVSRPTDSVKESVYGFMPAPTKSDMQGGGDKSTIFRNNRFIRTSKTTGTKFGAKLSSAYRFLTGRIYLDPMASEMVLRWPIGWTDLRLLETGKIQDWLEQF